MQLLTVIRQADNFNHAQVPFVVKVAGLIDDGCGDDGKCSRWEWEEGGGRRVFGAVSAVFPFCLAELFACSGCIAVMFG